MALRPRAAGARTAVDLLVIGLGNPGDAYAGTRHNAGRWAVRGLVRRHGGTLRRDRRAKAHTAQLNLAAGRVAAALPATYMNESGRAVGAMVRGYGLCDLTRLVIVHDELDLPVGRVKVKGGGGLAGHRGLKSIRDQLRSADFTRVRIGIDHPQRRPGPSGPASRGVPARAQPVVDHVLSRPSGSERTELRQAALRAADAVECLLEHGLEVAMNRFNVS